MARNLLGNSIQREDAARRFPLCEIFRKAKTIGVLRRTWLCGGMRSTLAVACSIPRSYLESPLGTRNALRNCLFSKPAAHMQSLHDAPPGRIVVVCFWHCSGFASPPRQTEPIAHTEHVNPLGRLSGNMLGGQRHSCKSADCDIFTKRFLTLASTHRTPLCAMVTITPTRTPIVRSDRQMRAACYEECSSCRQYPRDTLKAFQ